MTVGDKTQRIRVLVVDDSSFMRAAIARTLTATGRFEVVGQARDGADALAKVQALTPDVVTMDFNMPGQTGADAVREIMRVKPTPVVMFSAHTQKGARETFDALGAGAVDFVTKPAGEVSADLSRVQDELTQKLVAAASSRPRSMQRAGTSRPQKTPAPDSTPNRRAPEPAATAVLSKLCVVAVSTGGPAALSRLIPALPADTRHAVVVVQHMPEHFTSSLAERLDAESLVRVREARAGDRPRPGLVLIAPGDRHLEFDDRGLVVLHDGPLVHGCRPAADLTMTSAAKVYGRRACAIVMTGMGRDGAQGALAIRRADGRTLAQDETTSVIFGMPKAAIDAGAIEEVAPLDELAPRLRYL
ncbi:MAG: chemotaxis response regulator protein-glutamate methylesterase [Polyangiaceae bacterium]